MKNKVTIQQIADLTGMSKFAVSRALSGKPGVSSSTRETIVRMAGQLGYFKQRDRVPYASPSLPDNTEAPFGGEVEPMQGTILVLFQSVRYQNRSSVYWGPIFDGVSARLNESGVNVMTLTEPAGDTLFQLLNPVALKGVIALGMVSTQILLDIKRLGIPVVMIDHVDPALPCDTIYTDNVTSMRELVVKLISQGRKRFQFVGDIYDAHSFQERWLAFRAALEEYGLPHDQNPELIGHDDLYEIVPRLLREQPLPEVFVCVNDITALIVLNAARELGIAVPEQVGVTGFDDNFPDVQPGLTTVQVNKELLGQRAVDKLFWRIQNPYSQIEKTLIYAEPIYRDSV
jgi:LacI family transcriptional regulator